MGGGRRAGIVFFLAFCIPLIGWAQISLSGTVKNEAGEPLANAIVRVENEQGGILAFTTSSKEGTFALALEKPSTTLQLHCSALGFLAAVQPIPAEQATAVFAFVLQPKTTELNEVFVEMPQSIRVREDTITYLTKAFTDGTEQTVEEMLQKIPGIEVDEDGSINVNGKSISKLLVDGEDMFDQDYKILSKNMPAYPIEELDVLENYSENSLLKGIENSKAVAIDLKLGEAFKSIWFGNVEAGYGNDDFYSLRSNLMNFGKKNKYYFLNQLNNVGESTGANNFTYVGNTLSTQRIGDGEEILPLLALEPAQLAFNKNRTLFNDAELVSLNAIFNPNQKLKIKPQILYDGDETDFFRNEINTTNVNGTNFTNTENYRLRNNKRQVEAELEINYKHNKNTHLEATTRYFRGRYLDRSNLLFNSVASNENLNQNRHLFDQKILLTHRNQPNKAWVYTARIKNEVRPQTYTYDDFLFEDLLGETGENLRQAVDTRMLFLGVEAQRLHRMRNGDLWETRLGNTYRRDGLLSVFSFQTTNQENRMPADLQNDFAYGVNDLFLKNSYQKKLGNLRLDLDVDLHQFFNTLENRGETQSETPFFLNPKLGLSWKFFEKHTLVGSYAFSTSNATSDRVFPNFVLTNYRSFLRGTNSFDQLQSSRWALFHRYGNYNNRFLANTTIIYSTTPDFFGTNRLVAQNFTQTQYQLFRDRRMLNVQSKLDYFLKGIATNLKLDLGYNRSNFRNIVNGSDERNVRSSQFSYGAEARSGFKGIFNFHVGTKWQNIGIDTGITNRFTDNLSFLDLTLKPTKNLQVELQTERYHFGNLQQNPTYYFLDIEARYGFPNERMNLRLQAKNLFNTQTFRNFSLTDISRSTTEFGLLPRFVLLKFEYRFGQRPAE